MKMWRKGQEMDWFSHGMGRKRLGNGLFQHGVVESRLSDGGRSVQSLDTRGGSIELDRALVLTESDNVLISPFRADTASLIRHVDTEASSDSM